MRGGGGGRLGGGGEGEGGGRGYWLSALKEQVTGGGLGIGPRAGKRRGGGHVRSLKKEKIEIDVPKKGKARIEKGKKRDVL